MKRKNDYLQMQEQLQELERAMRPGNENYDALCKRLEEIGKPAQEITTTLYWHWLAQGKTAGMYLYATPPIGEAALSERVLIVGTKAETKDMYTMLEGLETYKRVMQILQERRHKLPSGIVNVLPAPSYEGSSHDLVIATKSIEKYGVSPEYVFSATVGSFWQSFFGEDNFLDHKEKVSIPMAIIGTGKMRHYDDRLGGTTLDVQERLEEIALAWTIPIQKNESWAQ